MSLKAVPIWGSAVPPNPQLGSTSDLGSRRFNFRTDLETFRKWECCAVLAQRATTPVEDEKPSATEIEFLGLIDQTQNKEPTTFHKDLNSLPSE